MPFVCRLIRNANRQKRDNRGDQIEPGVQRLRQHALATGAEYEKSLERNEHERRAHAQQRRALRSRLFSYSAPVAWACCRRRCTPGSIWSPRLSRFCLFAFRMSLQTKGIPTVTANLRIFRRLSKQGCCY